MAKKAMVNKSKRPQKFQVREYTRFEDFRRTQTELIK